MDQVLFLFDLEQIVPLEIAGKVQQNLLEARLNGIKRAVLSLLVSFAKTGQCDSSVPRIKELFIRKWSITNFSVT